MSNQEFFDSLDFTLLTLEISRRLGIPVKISEPFKLEKDKYLRFETDDLKEFTGVMRGTFEKVTVGAFSSCVDGENKCLWASIYFLYDAVRGSNGVEFFNVWCRNGQWDFK